MTEELYAIDSTGNFIFGFAVGVLLSFFGPMLAGLIRDDLRDWWNKR